MSNWESPTADGRPDTRVVSCDLEFSVIEPAEVVLQIEAASSSGRSIDEHLHINTDGGPPQSRRSLAGPHGGRLHIVNAGPGRLAISYRAELEIIASPPWSAAPGAPSLETMAEASPAYEQQLYLRPSRYCPSDHLVGFAVAEFGASGDVATRVADITDWLRRRVGYVPGSSSVHDSAEHTLLTAMGTCRDFAHLGIALCRATGVPARFVAVYAPGLFPMDFHAVFEAFEDGRWYAHDATGLAPRSSMVRIGTGRDAADTAFAGVTHGVADLTYLSVSAIVGSALPLDDPTERVELR